ncbi:MAG TPA: hypothetical protein VNT76_19475 [Candidatus Binatus sp.]|nr:hypothetical protein [Candidatus Binatus sp.]
MLKISTRREDGHTNFELEGRLAGAWVDELRECWQNARRNGDQITVALTQVTYIDNAGKAILTEMHRLGAQLAAEGCMVKAIIEEIRRGGVER